MPTIAFSELLGHVPDVLHIHGDAIITSPIVESSLDVQSGGVFVARDGLLTDGHKYIPDAIQSGAAGIVGQRAFESFDFEMSVPYAQVGNAQAATGILSAAYYDFPSRQLAVIGVTGTDGKTTTSTFIHSILKIATEGKSGYISTLAADLGGVTSDTGLHVTTPTAPAVQSFLRQMVDNGMKYCVLEMTSHGLAQHRLSGVDIDAAVLTNVTHEHLDYHGTWEAYRDAKAKMFHALKSSYGNTVPKISVINNDDPNNMFFAGIPADVIVKYGIQAGADYRAEDIEYHSKGIYFRVGDQLYTLNLFGAFNVLNALAAISVTKELGIADDHIRQGIESVQTLSGRMERVDMGQDFTAIVDFAHTPNALKNALQACRLMLKEGQRLIAVFGSAGLRDVEKRRMMAEVSAQLADFTVLTAEDPRTESLDDILQMMADGCMAKGGIEGKTFIRVPDRGEALYRACQIANAGDIVIACGKGHEQSMCFGAVEHPWDDRNALKAALLGQPLQTLPTAI